MTESAAEYAHEVGRVKAAREIAAAERSWSASRSLSERSRRPDLTPEERMASFAVQCAFYELTELEEVPADALPAVLGMFASDKELLNATLGRLEMDGEWDETLPFERELFSQLFDAEYKNIRWIRRDDPAAKISITIPAGFTDQIGFVALQRKRRLIIAEHINGSQAPRPSLEVDKVSTFALDIAALQGIDDDAAAEVRLIVALTMFKALNFGALARAYTELEADEEENLFTAGKYLLGSEANVNLGQGLNSADFKGYLALDNDHKAAIQRARELESALRRNNISLADIHHRLEHIENPTKLHHPRGVAFIEEAIRARHKLLTPSITTYYAH